MYLNCKTYYSFNFGTFSTKGLVEAAVDQGVTALALTNINNTCDAWEFVKCCKEAGVKPIAGTEIRNGDVLLYILVAANNMGLAWINEFLSEHLLAGKDFSAVATDSHFFASDRDGFVIYPWGARSPENLLPNERIGLLPGEITKLFGFDGRQLVDKFVVRQPVTVQNKTYFALHRLLRSIHNNLLLSKLSPAAHCSADETFISTTDLLSKFRDYPVIVTNTYKVMDACSVELGPEEDKNKASYSGSKDDDRILLAKLAEEGLVGRYGSDNKIAEQRLHKELTIINDLGFNSYFLINWDFVRYAQLRGFYHVGRGSGANSIVAYCLRITDVDPIELNLFFERFLNPHRTSPPDFDIDFSHTDRDDVIDYIFKRYGKNHGAFLGSYPTSKPDSIIRQLGNDSVLPDEEIATLQQTT